MSFFVAGAVLGEVQVSLFVAGAALGEGQVYLFVVGAVFGEGLNVRLGAKRCILQLENASGDLEKQAHLRGGLRFAFSWSDHARIMLGSCSDRPRIGNDVSSVFGDFLWNLAVSLFVPGAVFGEVGSWYLLLRALEMRFHMWRRSSMRVILCGRRGISWGSSVTFRGRCSTWWRSSVSFCGRRSIWWRFECKIGGETLYFTIENASGDLEKQAHLRGGLRFAFSWSDHARIMLGSCSDRPRIGNDVSSVFGDFLWNLAVSLFVPGAVFGEVGSWYLLLRALEMRFHMWRRSSMRVILCGRRGISWGSSVTFRGRCSTWWRSSVSFCGRRSIWWRFECKIGGETLYFTIENASGDLEKQAHLRGGLRFAFSWSDHARIMLGSAPHWKWRFICFWRFSLKSCSVIVRARRSIWWGWIVIPVAPRIGNEVSYVTTIKHASHFVWQAQYLVRLDRDTCCSAHWKWGFICDDDQACESFCVAGAVFREVGSWYLLLPALEMRFHMWRRSSMRVILCGRRGIWWGLMVTPVAPRIVNDVSYVTTIKHASHSVVAGAVFGEVGWWHLLLRAL